MVLEAAGCQAVHRQGGGHQPPTGKQLAPGTAAAEIAGIIARAYAAAFPILAALSLAGLVVALALRSLPPLPVVALMLGSVCAIASRVALLAYLDATSIPSANLLYASPATPFAIVAVALGLFSGADALVRTYRVHSRGDASRRAHADPCLRADSAG